MAKKCRRPFWHSTIDIDWQKCSYWINSICMCVLRSLTVRLLKTCHWIITYFIATHKTAV